MDELNSWQGQSMVTNLISLDEFTAAGSDVKMDASMNSHFEQPESAVEKEELKVKIAEALDLLTEKERNVIVLYGAGDGRE